MLMFLRLELTKICFRRGLNSGPFVRQTKMLTTTLRKPIVCCIILVLEVIILENKNLKTIFK